MAKELKRLNMNMPVDLIDQVDQYADKMNVNRSAAINMLLSMALHQNLERIKCLGNEVVQEKYY